MTKTIREELEDEAYRSAFVAAHISTGLAFQIEALREQRGWTQKDLGERAGLKQSAISRLEGPRHSSTIATLKKLAAAFDVAMVVRFAPFSELATWVSKLGPGSLAVPSFAQDPGFQTKQEVTATVPEPSRVEMTEKALLLPAPSYSSPHMGIHARTRTALTFRGAAHSRIGSHSNA